MCIRVIVLALTGIFSLISILSNFRKAGIHNPIGFNGLTNWGRILLVMGLPLFAMVFYYQVSDYKGNEIAISTLNNRHYIDSIQAIKNRNDLIDTISAKLQQYKMTISESGEILQINNGDNECATMAIANNTTKEGENNVCWDKNFIIARIGDVINVAIYYHNSGVNDINDLSFRLSDPTGSIVANNEDISIRGEILVEGRAITSNNVRLKVTGGAGRLVLGNIEMYSNKDKQNILLNNKGDIITKKGLFYGTLKSGWDYQGAIKVAFTVVPERH